MSHQFFTNSWMALSAKDKKSFIQEKFLGLNPVVVYVDSEPEGLEIFSERCEQLGLKAFVSSKTEDVLDYLKSSKARVLMVICELNLKTSSGQDFRSQLLSFAPDLPFYLMTTLEESELNQQAAHLKITGILSKPFHMDRFIEILRQDCEKRAGIIKDEYEMLKSFTDDVVNIVGEIEEGCLQLENDPKDQETVSRIFGLVHTVKGSSGFFEPRTLHVFAHSFEEKLKLVQAGQIQVSSPLISSWLKACDVIKKLNEELISGEHGTHDVEELKLILEVQLTTHSATSQVQVEIEQEKEKRTENKEQKPSDLKVSMKVLDEFTQVSGELTVIRNMINKVVGAIEKQYPTDKDVQNLSELLEEMHKINSDMQGKITDIRRVPASQLIKPLSRNLRDTSKALNKEVDFIVEGEELRLDNAIADTLSRCLVHLMRNSLDHGLEGNEERKKIGKNAKGKLKLKFESVNESILVTLEDDGRGINTDKIRQKVISQGLRSADEASRMPDEELHLMIFEAGFSTAAQVTEFSGRGVGMSMVKETIEQQQGKIRIHSEKGKGSRFSLEIPIPKSVLITNCLFVSACEMTFGIPQEFVIRVLDQNALGQKGVESLGGSRFIRFEGDLVPVISLSDTLELNKKNQESLLVVLDTHGQVFALEVGQVMDTEDAVIKPLTINALKSLAVYQGGTFLGDGTVGLIMDIPGLAEKLCIKKKSVKTLAPTQVDTHHLENIISFTLNSPGCFAIAEKDVFRVEVLQTRNMVMSGEQLVMPYRESMMTMVDLESVLFGKIPNLNAQELAPALIVKSGDQYLGLLVQEIRDLEAVKMEVIAPLRKKVGLEGHVLHQGLTFSLLSLRELKQLFSEPRASITAGMNQVA